jgi:hypothetical protein
MYPRKIAVPPGGGGLSHKSIKQYFEARIYSKNCLTCFCIFFKN